MENPSIRNPATAVCSGIAMKLPAASWERLEDMPDAGNAGVIHEASLRLEPCPVPIPETRPGGLAGWQIRRLQAYIDDRLSGPLCGPRMAAVIRLSPSHFARSFKISFRCTPHAYVVRRRMERARYLMLATEMPLAEIALACGLADQSHLSRLFLRFEGNSPSAWRREQLGRAMEPPVDSDADELLDADLQHFRHPDQVGKGFCRHLAHHRAAVNLDRDFA